jgi:hypothetical protein
MLEPNNRLDVLAPTQLTRESSPQEQLEEYTALLPQETPRPPDTPPPPEAQRRRSSFQSQHRHAADALTHPTRNFHLPCLATRNAAHAEELLSVYCGRLSEWGLATFEPTSPEARLLHELTTLNILLQSSAQAHAADPSNFETETHASAVLSLTREAMHAKDNVTGFRLSFELDKHIYDIVEVTQCLHAAAVSTLLGLFLST